MISVEEPHVQRAGGHVPRSSRSSPAVDVIEGCESLPCFAALTGGLCGVNGANLLHPRHEPLPPPLRHEHLRGLALGAGRRVEARPARVRALRGDAGNLHAAWPGSWQGQMPNAPRSPLLRLAEDRASASQAECREFESHRALHSPCTSLPQPARRCAFGATWRGAPADPVTPYIVQRSATRGRWSVSTVLQGAQHFGSHRNPVGPPRIARRPPANRRLQTGHLGSAGQHKIEGESACQSSEWWTHPRTTRWSPRCVPSISSSSTSWTAYSRPCACCSFFRGVSRASRSAAPIVGLMVDLLEPPPLVVCNWEECRQPLGSPSVWRARCCRMGALAMPTGGRGLRRGVLPRRPERIGVAALPSSCKEAQGSSAG